MEEQRRKARDAHKTTNYMGADASIYEEMDPALTSEFVGYDHLEHTSDIRALVKVSGDEGKESLADVLTEEERMEGTIIVDETPFYATMGGQIGDSGVISSPKGSFTVKDTFKGESAGEDRSCGADDVRGAARGRYGYAEGGCGQEKRHCQEPQCHPPSAESAARGSGKPCGAGGMLIL